MKNYYLGLDIGTNSCGFAVTDENYNLLRFGGKNLWGVRLFDEATTAVKRRSKRASRRRLDRKKLKISWLNEIFSPEIDKVDKTMLSRLKYSSLWEEDKVFMDNALNSKDSLFCDKDYTDKDFFYEYPTIFHLRRELTKEQAKDVRFLYLAIHSIIKNRGHFLYEGDFGDEEKIITLSYVINDMIEFLMTLESEEFKDGIMPKLNKIDETLELKIYDILKKKLGVKDTKNGFYEIMSASNKVEKAVIDTIITGKAKLKDFLNFESEEKIELVFDSEDFESQLDSCSSFLSDEQIELIQKLKSVNININLKKIIGDNNYICEAMVDLFETHKEDLREFKSFVKIFYPNYYFDMFRNPFDETKSKKRNLDKKSLKNHTNYANYVGGTIFKGKKRVVGLDSGREKEEFYKCVKELLGYEPDLSIGTKEDYDRIKSSILNKIENGIFLPKLRTKSNAVLPNKLYLKELSQILKVNSEKFSFLSEKDESGLTNSEKIIEIAKFRVPYFIGPIGDREDAENKFGWAEKTGEKLEFKPWTLNKIVDYDKSEDGFILRLTNSCTYLNGRDVLPKHSILYSKYRVLNELNKLKIDGNDISVELKQKIYLTLFENNKKVTKKKVIEFLVSEGIIDIAHSKEVVLSGIDKEFANNLNSLNDIKSKNVFSDEFLNQNIQVFEKIIKYNAIIGDKERLLSRIKREYPNLFSNEQLKAIKSFNFSGWGSLSKEFLEDLKFINKKTGEVTCIINELWNTNQNLQQILFNSDYTLQEKLLEYNKTEIEDLNYDIVKDMYCSPAVKRGVWQSLQIIDEVKKLLGCMPEKIFIEVTRNDAEKGDKGRKLSRQNSLLEIYKSKDFKKSVEKTGCDLDFLFSELNKRDNLEFQSEKLYLYFLQLGKCMYSGESIDINDLYDDNLYDVDHIIPQSIIKDDSINNKVLVKKQYNLEKSDVYPILMKFPNWVKKQEPFWNMLLKLGLISKPKFERLISSKPLTDEDLSGFVARQMVETNQSSKAVIDLLKKIVDDPRKVVYSKANFVSEFRNMFDIYKSREVNDFHHAKDAYLNIVVGNIMFCRFTEDPRNFYKNDKNPNKKLTKNPLRLFNSIIKNYAGDIIWDKDKNLAKVKEICFRNDPIVTRMSFCNYNSDFYDETVYKSIKNNPNTEAKISLKGNDKNPLSNIEKYGGFNKLKTAYFMVVESDDKKGNRQKTIETVPVLVYQQNKKFENRDERIFEYVVKENNLKNAKIILPKLNIQSTLKINNGLYLLAGKTNDRFILHNFNQWYVDNNTTRYVKNLTKYQEKKKGKSEEELNFIEENDRVVISKASKRGNREIILSREENIKLYDMIVSQLKKSIYEETNIQNMANSLEDSREKFLELSVLHQANLLLGVLPRISTGASLADLSEIGLASKSGNLTIGKDITDKNISLVVQSFTGIKEKIIKL